MFHLLTCSSAPTLFVQPFPFVFLSLISSTCGLSPPGCPSFPLVRFGTAPQHPVLSFSLTIPLIHFSRRRARASLLFTASSSLHVISPVTANCTPFPSACDINACPPLATPLPHIDHFTPVASARETALYSLLVRHGPLRHLSLPFCARPNASAAAPAAAAVTRSCAGCSATEVLAAVPL